MDHHDATDAGSHAFHESSPAHQNQEPHVVSASLSSPSSPSVSGSPYRHRRHPHPAAAWVGTQLSITAATGLASSHSAPFARVLYQIPSSSSRDSRSSKKKKKKATKVVCLDNQDSQSCRRRLRREQNGRYTAIWEKHPSRSSGECGFVEEDDGDFLLPPSLEYLEIQVWNQFLNGFDVFLGMATLTISSLYQQQQQQQPQQLQQQEPNSSIIRTPLMWIPLQVSNDKENDSRTDASVAIAQMNLSVQLQVSFLHDTKAFRVRQQIAQRCKEKKTPTENPVQSITDPAFAFTKPFQAIDWSAVVSTSVRHIFFHVDVDRLSSFKTQVMYGDLFHELQEDEGLHIHDDHLSAFQLSQLSAQYLSHCVDTLTTRCEEYSDQYRVLAETRSNLLKTRSQLVVGERSKSKRIEDEKKWLEQLMRDRRSREEHQLRLSNLVERGRHRAATTIQRFFHHKLAHYKHRQIIKALIAATRIQSWLRGYISRTKVVPKVEEQRRCARELDLMAQNEREMRGVLRCEYERELVQRIEVQTKHDQEQQHQHHASPVLSPLSSPLLKQDVSALVSMYRKLRRIFLLAYHQHGGKDGSAYQSLFAKLDLRQDGALDRAEFRLGVRNFGIRIDRKLTRALIALVRAKCGVQPQPLHLNMDQFVKGFDLPVHDPKDGNTDITPFEKAEQRWKAHQEPQSSTTARDSKEKVEDDKNDDAEGPSAEADQIAVVSQAVENLRLKILDAAKSHLEAQGKQFSNYRDFRDALTFVFEEFDVDKSGELDLDEIVACIESINFQVTSENLALLRDCFACDDDDGDGKISIPEFISFALATGSGGSTGQQQTEENLGIVGSRLREAVLERVRAAQKQTETVEDAVRSVFRRAYSRKNQQTCTATIFIKALSGLKLPVRSAQLARLVMKLDKDGDHSISFDELLLWLRLRRASELVARRNNSDELFPTNLGVRRHSHVAKASAIAKLVRSVLHQLAGLPADNNPNAMSPSSSWRLALTQVFGKIDRNGSKKITREEVQGFLAAQDAAWLLSVLNASGRLKCTELELTSPDSIPLALADAVVNTIDLNRNGVVTLDEWLEFLEQPEVSGDRGGDRQTDRFALINSVRTLLLEAVKKDEAVLIAWFHGLSGALPAASASGGGESQAVMVMKVRVNVFKTALRAKLGAKSISVPLQAIDEAVKRLDGDSSDWVTTRELQNWAFPIRDLEELSRAIASRWRVEEEQHAHNAKEDQEADFALALYSRFDADGNGILAQREIRGGFASFGLQFKIEEVIALTKAFDLDQDGCWSKAEFLAFVYTFFPHAIFPKSSYSTAVLEAEAHIAQTATESDAGIAAGSKMEEDASDEENYGREGFLSPHSSSSSVSSVSSASAARSSSSPAGDASQLLSSPMSSTAGSKVADYSQDFD